MHVFVTGGTGVLGRAAVPLLAAAGHQVTAPGSGDLDLFDPAAVRWAVARWTSQPRWVRCARTCSRALTVAPGIYNVTDGTGPVSSARFMAATGWRPRH